MTGFGGSNKDLASAALPGLSFGGLNNKYWRGRHRQLTLGQLQSGALSLVEIRRDPVL